jgi:drug/metabolite transporter (DMT)-like permease
MSDTLSSHAAVRAVGILLIVVGACIAALFWVVLPSGPEAQARAAAVGASAVVFGVAVWALSVVRARRRRALPAAYRRRAPSWDGR